MHARYYTPVGGRFLSMDPGGNALSRPQSWNRYAYAANSPISVVDPDGGEIIQFAELSRNDEFTSTVAQMRASTFGATMYNAIQNSQTFKLTIEARPAQPSGSQTLPAWVVDTPYGAAMYVRDQPLRGRMEKDLGHAKLKYEYLANQAKREFRYLAFIAHEFGHGYARLTHPEFYATRQCFKDRWPTEPTDPAELMLFKTWQVFINRRSEEIADEYAERVLDEVAGDDGWKKDKYR